MTAPDPRKTKLHVLPPPPTGFDPFAATKDDLERYGLPRRPDPFKEPGMAALWDRCARRYQAFDHLTPTVQDSPTAPLQRLLCSGLVPEQPHAQPLARFGVVYFDEILAYSTGGSQLLTDGQAITMVDFDGSPTLASPVQLNDYAFKAVHR